MNAFPTTIVGRPSVESSIEEVLDGEYDSKAAVTGNTAEPLANGSAGNGDAVTNGLTNGAVKGRESSTFEKEDGDDAEQKIGQTKKKGGVFRKLHLLH